MAVELSELSVVVHLADERIFQTGIITAFLGRLSHKFTLDHLQGSFVFFFLMNWEQIF